MHAGLVVGRVLKGLARGAVEAKVVGVVVTLATGVVSTHGSRLLRMDALGNM